MVDETISSQLGELLSKFPPFHFLKKSELLNLSKKIEIRFFAEKDILFEEGKKPDGFFFFIQKGSVELLWNNQGKQDISDICDTGEIIGLKAILGNRNYLNTARAHEDTLVLVIPFSSFQPYLESNPKISLYFASGFTSGRVLQRSAIQGFENARKEFSKQTLPSTILRDFDTFSMYKEKEIISCNPETSIKNAADLMNKKNVGSILILDIDKKPIGIVTDVDFRKKVIPDNIDTNSPVTKIMSRPVYSVKKDISLAETMLIMLRNNIRHLCITKDGTEQSEAIGIITEHDVLLLQSNNPAIITKEIFQARNLNELPRIRNKIEDIVKEYVRQEVSIHYILEIITEINDSLISKIIELSIIELKLLGFTDPEVNFVWLALGSEGRREQAHRTDQDNAILYEDPSPEKAQDTKLYFLELAKMVTGELNACGFAFCPGNIMASNPDLCKSMTEWKNSFFKWIRSGSPEAVLNCSIFFDFRCVYGSKDLSEALESYIHEKIEENQNILRYMALNAVSNSPPLGLFRNFLLEKNGKHKHELNIKLRGISPLVDGARVLALKYKVKNRNTYERLEALKEKVPEFRKEYEEAANTFHILSRFRLVHSIQNSDSNNYINPDNLSKIEREILKNSFGVIKDLQTHLENHFQLNLMQR